MAMTRQEYYAKNEILDRLGEQGYPTYASLLSKFDVNLTSDPGVVGYTEIGKGRIVLNKGLDIDQVSTVVRHEILHNFLKHMQRMEEKLGKEVWGKRTKQMHEASNIAGDYEISNRGYTEKDKQIARNISLNGETLQGLVTEDQHPDWVDLSLEEMYDKLIPEMEKSEQQMQNSLQSDSSNSGSDSSQAGGADKSGSSGGGKRRLSIGDKGDPEIQKAEDLERRANAVSDDAGELIKQANKEGDSKTADQAQKAKDAVDKAGDEAGNLADGLKGEKPSTKEAEKQQEAAGVPTEQKPFGDPEKINARLKELERILSNADDDLDKALSETRSAKYKEKQEKGDLAAKKYKDSPLTRFRESLNGFLRSETDYGRDKTWRRFSKNYSNSGLIRPGTARNIGGKIPKINVYFDQSSSWDSEKISVGRQAIATLNKYVQRREVEIKVFYFSDEIFTDPNSPLSQQATSAGPDIIEHIQETKADNVIIMTDGDFDYQGNWKSVDPISVPGGVWFLFKDGESKTIQKYLKGKKLTKSFKI